jgi:vacuolar-type H+-ATPase subunit H
MGPQSDVDRIREIYRAEREADRIVRDAQAEAEALLEGAKAAAGAALAAQRIDFARRAGEALETETAEIEREAQTLLESARLRAEAWVRRAKPEIDAVASALLSRILPP